MNEIEIKSNGQLETYEPSDGVMSIRVPIKITRREGRKIVKRPSGEFLGSEVYCSTISVSQRSQMA